MNGVVKAVVVLGLMGTLIFLCDGAVGPCETNGAFACTDPVDDCDYYTCVYYSSLNKWLLTKYKCEAPSTWDDEVKKCVAPTPAPPPPGN